MNESEWFEFQQGITAWRNRLSPRDFKSWNTLNTLIKVLDKALNSSSYDPPVAGKIMGRLKECWAPLNCEEQREDYY